MELHTSSTHRGLNIKMKIGGLEAFDLICCLILMAMLNLLLGKTNWGFAIAFGLPSLILSCLYLGKKNRPDDFLLHLIRYYLTPGFYSAGERSKNLEKMRGRIDESNL